MRLRELAIDASVADSATLGDAIAVLAAVEGSAVAIVRPDRSVLGLVDARRVLHGLFPAYVRELTHTAFAEDDIESIRRRRREALAEPVTAYMAEPVVVEADVSSTHVAERFMHTALQGLAVVEDGRYVGVVSLEPLVRALLRELNG